VGFAYGQRHAAEMEARERVLAAIRARFPKWAAKLGEDHVLALDVLKDIGGTAMTEKVAFAARADGLPNTFVPGRNLMFLFAAAALAARRGMRDLVGGMCETDYSGYPDCRADTMAAMQQALRLGMAGEYTIHTPLMRIDKAETWRLAERLGGRALVDLIVDETVTCYLGDRERRHDWGYGCGRCPACKLRAGGFERYREGVTACRTR
jgi:7-cyano-7-deazaguanine synthase